MVRYYRRRYRPYSRGDRWAVETKSVAILTNKGATESTDVTIVGNGPNDAKRTVKNITISMSVPISFRWAIVYVPEGTTVGQLKQRAVGQIPGAEIVSLYEPNQFVMAAGTYDSGAGPNRIFCPLARKLNSNDKISLII